MKKMKFSLISLMLVFVTAASAQVSLGIKGGLNMSNFYGDELTDKNVKLGFHVGLAADYDFAYNMAIQSGLFFSTKGAKFTSSIGELSGEYSVNPMYLQIPVHLAYKVDVTPATRLVLHAGPYVAYGVGGKTEIKGSLGEISGEVDGGNVFGENNLFKPFDAGLGLGVGAEFGPILLDLGWDMGLVNISRNSNGNFKTQNAYLSVGYKF